MARVSALCFEAPTVSLGPEALACRVHRALFIPLFFFAGKKGSLVVVMSYSQRLVGRLDFFGTFDLGCQPRV